MGGWGRMGLNVAPDGRVTPCHAAMSLPGLDFESVRDRPLAEIWTGSDAFNAFRGTEWMPEPCRSCPRKTRDWGGCRCQAYAWTGDAAATDPACSLAPGHAALRQAAEAAAEAPGSLIYREMSRG
jgi:pyrroloquinoline quinone biosynthesis protein E